MRRYLLCILAVFVTSSFIVDGSTKSLFWLTVVTGVAGLFFGGTVRAVYHEFRQGRYYWQIRGYAF